MNGAACFHIDYNFNIALLEGLSIEVTLIGTLYDDNAPPNVQDQYALAPFNVPVGRTVSGWTNMEHSNGYHNGPAMFQFSVTKRREHPDPDLRINDARYPARPNGNDGIAV